MALLLFILIVIICVIIGLLILVQNPKGGGLSGSIAGFNNQFMGVKQTTDVLEKGTWIFVSALTVLSLISVLLLSNVSDNNANPLQNINTNQQGSVTAPQQQTAPGTAPLQLQDSNN
ncbi:MAG: preprotein translocase subunit SecG [Bacteroidetes bacterium]|nr:preprotein translocase subunit SecG [Bacteroidota bacterium]